MRLYTRTGAIALDDPEYGHFDADENGGFDFDDELSDRLHQFARRGAPMWETDIERQHRMVAEEMEKAKDPATLLAAVQQLVQAAQAVSAPRPPAVQTEADAPAANDGPAEDDAPAAPKQPRKRAAAKPAADAE